MKNSIVLACFLSLLSIDSFAQLSGTFSPSGGYTGIRDTRLQGIVVYEQANFRGKGHAVRPGRTLSNVTVGSVRVYGGYKAKATMTYGVVYNFISDMPDASWPIRTITAEHSDTYKGAILYTRENQRGAAWYLDMGPAYNSQHNGWYAHYPHPVQPKSIRVKGSARVRASGASNIRTLTTGDYNYASGINHVQVISRD